MGFIVFLLCIAVSVLIINTVTLHNYHKKHEEELHNLRVYSKDLNDKLSFLYSIVKDADMVPGVKPSANNNVRQEEKKTGVDLTKTAAEQQKGETSSARKIESPVSSASRPMPKSVRTSELTVKPVHPTNMPQHTFAAAQTQPAQVSAQRTAQPVTPAARPQQTFAATQTQPAQVSAQHTAQPVTPAAQPVTLAAQPQQAFAAAQTQTAQPSAQNNSQPVRTAFRQQAYQAQPDRPAPVIKKKPHIEEWLGARLFNIAASLLIFIGLILFCTLSTEVVTNNMKMGAMFAVSGGFIAVGAFLSRKDRSIFPLGMLGTGFGSFFISILLSHIYFHSLNDIAAFGLILVWSAFALYLSRRLDSVMLSVTAHIGTAISICFAYSMGFTPEKVIILTIYQFAAIAVIIIGNIFCCRKTYRFGLIMTQCLLVYTSIAMSVAFSQKFIMPGSISVAAAIVIYTVQFLAISFVSYLVSTSAAALEKENNTKLGTLAVIIHLLNKIFWIAGTLSTVAFITHYICRNAYHTDVLIPTTIAVTAALLLHLCLTVFMEEKLSFSAGLSTLSMWFISSTIVITLMVGAQNVGAPFLFIYALILIGIFKLTKNTGVDYIATLVLIIEAAYMCFYGYFKLENVWISIPYMVAIGAVLLLLWFVQDGKHKQNYFKYMKIAEYLWISASIIPINASQYSDISVPLIVSEFALMNIICYFIKFGSENEPELRMVVKAESLLTVYIGIFILSYEYINTLGNNNIIKAVFCVMLFVLTLIQCYEFIRTNINLFQAIAAATAAGYFTFLAIGFQEYFKPFEYFASTLKCMPFFFLFSVILIGIYLINKNRNLTIYIWPALLIDMLFMGFSGYRLLISEAYTNSTHYLNIGLHIVLTGVALAHAAAVLGLTFLLSDDTVITEKIKNSDFQRYVSFLWINLAFPMIAFNYLNKTGLNDYKWVVAMMILTAVNTAVFALNYQGEFHSTFNYVVRIVSAVVFYMALPSISDSHNSIPRYAASVVLMLFCAALFFVKSKEILKHDPSLMHQLYVGINSTIFVNIACSGLSSEYDFAYIFSIVTMIAALVCIIVGFAAKAKGIRIYGLVVIMLCIIKLVTIDISGADSLARVMSFIVGGIICFIISGIYNRMEKHFKAQEQEAVPVMQAVSANGAPVSAVSAPIDTSVTTAVNAPVENTMQASPENQLPVTETPAETAQENIPETTAKTDAPAKQDNTPTENTDNTDNNSDAQ